MSDSPNTPSFLPPADLAKELSAPESGSPGDESIRPSRLEDFIGQEELRANLRVFLNAARERGQAMDHVLFYGNPGLGKTTLAQIMAAELGVNLICTSGPVLERRSGGHPDQSVPPRHPVCGRNPPDAHCRGGNPVSGT